MNKELTPLEALERMIYNGYVNPNVKELKIIKAALKEYERMTYLCNGCVQHSKTYYNEKKALEIIKEKRVNIDIFINCCINVDYQFYLDHHKVIMNGMSNEEFTKEEFDLLREVLL